MSVLEVQTPAKRVQAILVLGVLAGLVYVAVSVLGSEAAFPPNLDPPQTAREAPALAPAEPTPPLATVAFEAALPDRSARVELQVVDGDGLPVGSAVLYFAQGPRRAIPLTQETPLWHADEQGVISLPASEIPPGGEALVHARGYEHCRLPPLKTGTRTTVRLVRHPAHCVRFVNENTGEPVPGVRLRVSTLAPATHEPLTTPLLPGSRHPIHDYTSGRDGTVRIRELPSGAYQAFVTHPSCLTLRHGPSFVLNVQGGQTTIPMIEARGFVIRILPRDGCNQVEALYPPAAIPHTAGTAHLMTSLSELERRLLRRWPEADMVFVMAPNPSLADLSDETRVPVRIFRGSYEVRRMVAAQPLSKLNEPLDMDLSDITPDASRVSIQAVLPGGERLPSCASLFAVVGTSTTGRKVTLTHLEGNEVILPYGDYNLLPAGGHLLEGAVPLTPFTAASSRTQVRVDLRRPVVRCEITFGLSATDPLDEWRLWVRDAKGRILYGRLVREARPVLWLPAGASLEFECAAAGLSGPVRRRVVVPEDETEWRVHVPLDESS